MIFPSFEQVRIFLAVKEQGSFSNAAQYLQITQATVSRNISSLEKIIEQTLFLRNTRSVQLTEAGEIFAQYADNLLKDWQTAKLKIDNQADSPHGEINIAAPQLFTELFIAKQLPEFLNNYPEVKVNLTVTEKRESIIEHDYDLVVRTGALASSNLYYSPICHTPLAIVASPNFLKRHGQIEKPQDLPLNNCVNFRGDNEWSFEKNQQTTLVRPQSRFNTENAPFLLSLIINGFGIAISPYWLIKKYIDSNQLTVLLEEHKVTSLLDFYGELNFIYPSKTPTKKVRLLMSLIQGEVERTLTNTNLARFNHQT